MKEKNKIYRTQYCGKINEDLVDKKVTISGWVNSLRDLGNIKFIHMRDVTGLIQVVFNKENLSVEQSLVADRIKYEYLLNVTGTVTYRSKETINDKINTGNLEVFVESFEVINKSKDLPFMIDRVNLANENIRLKYRYLDIRRESLRKTLILRSVSNKVIRDFLNKNHFYEIDTPILCKSTPEGARDYLVPSRIHKGSFYALPQSPQLYKQMLMIGGMDRYYQFAKSFRDEDLRSDRQPEFTQLDMEMSFIEKEEDVMSFSEKLISNLFDKVVGVKPKMPFKKITYDQAIKLYGSDKPDLRFGMEIIDFSEVLVNTTFPLFKNAINSGGAVKGLVAKNLNDKITRKKLDELVKLAKSNNISALIAVRKKDGVILTSLTGKIDDKSLGSIVDYSKMDDNDLLILAPSNNDLKLSVALGIIRLEIGRKYDLINKEEFNFSWVIDFPMFEYCEETKKYGAVHHPFTSPKDSDLKYLESNDLSKVKAKAYDMVINGQEVGGGSIRISDNILQNKVFEVIGLTKSDIDKKFGFFLNALEYGTPPHGGIAFGYDRLIMLLSKTDNIKDVIAFPKIQNASSLLTKAPDIVDDSQLDELGIKIIKKEF